MIAPLLPDVSFGRVWRFNHPAGGNAELAYWFALERQWLGVPQPGC